MAKNQGRRGWMGSPSAWPGALCLELLINNGLCVKKLKQQNFYKDVSAFNGRNGKGRYKWGGK